MAENREQPRFRHLAFALAGAALLFLTAFWNYPLEPEHPTVGLLVENLVRDFWDWGERRHGFEFLIAAFTLMLGSFTGTLWWATRKVVIASPQIERAYISAGGTPLRQITGYQQGPMLVGAGTTLTPITVRTNQFELHVNNHGKTPGETTEFGIGFCEADDIPDTAEEPPYNWSIWPDWIGPGTQSRPIKLIEIPDNLTNPVIYGRFRYKDIFGTLHSSGFILKITANGSEPILAPAAYTQSD